MSSGASMPRLDRRFDVVRQLGAGGGKELDAVVVERIVRRADHDARREPQRARQVGDAGRGQRPAKIDVDARGREARLERSFQHVAGDARVLADQDAGPVAARWPPPRDARRRPRQRAPGRLAQLQHELGRDRRFAHAAAHAVGAEIFAFHRPVQPVFDWHATPSTHRRVSRTSCTRTMAAPRATAANAAATLAAARSFTSRPVIPPSIDLRDRPASTG